jgi:hypothetical protein
MNAETKPKKFLIRRMLAMGFLVVLFLFGVTVYINWQSHQLRLEKQNIVQSWVKVEVKPTQCFPDKELRFEVSMESFQNKEASKMDLAKTALLVDESENAYAPKYWKVKSSSEYAQKGILAFPISGKPKRIKLSLFVPEEAVLEWDLTLSSKR